MSDTVEFAGYRWVVPPPPQLGVDVVVERIIGTIIARAVDKYGSVLYEGEDHVEAFRVALSKGRYIFVYPGEYDFGGEELSIAGKSNIAIIGAGMGRTIIRRGAIVKNDPRETENVVIANMTIDGENAIDKLINLAENSRNFWLIGLHLKNSKGMGLYWGGSSVKVIGCVFENLGTDGYDMAAGHNPYDDDYALFMNNIFKYTLSSGGGGMITTGGSKEVRVINNKFYDVYGVKYAPISFENVYGSVDRVIVKSNTFVNLGSNVRGLNIGNKADGNYCGEAIVEGNVFIGYQLNVKGFQRFVVKGNVFYKPAGYAILVDVATKAFGKIVDNVIIDPNEVSNSWPNNTVIYVYDFQGFIDVSNNIVVDTRSTPKMVNGIVLSEARGLGVYYAKVIGNYVKGGTGDAIQTSSNVDADVCGNIADMSVSLEGKLRRNGGTATFTGDGSTTQFKIAHGLMSTPKIVIVTPKGSTPKPDSVDWDDTYIYINYSTAPAAGTTLVFSWFAEC